MLDKVSSVLCKFPKMPIHITKKLHFRLYESASYAYRGRNNERDWRAEQDTHTHTHTDTVDVSVPSWHAANVHLVKMCFSLSEHTFSVNKMSNHTYFNHVISLKIFMIS